jgi:anti-anti-sigma factor
VTQSAWQQLTIRETTDTNGVLRLTLFGELDVAVADRLEERARHLARLHRPLRVDLSQLDFIDARGLDAVISCLSFSRGHGIPLEIAPETSQSVRRLIDLLGVAEHVWPKAPEARPDRLAGPRWIAGQLQHRARGRGRARQRELSEHYA